jgi:hypothetical protein
MVTYVCVFFAKTRSLALKGNNGQIQLIRLSDRRSPRLKNRRLEFRRFNALRDGRCINAFGLLQGAEQIAGLRVRLVFPAGATTKITLAGL